MVKLDKKLGPTCEYTCDGLDWQLTGGWAPPGYYCPQISDHGICTTIGDVAFIEPVPIVPGVPEVPASPSIGANSAAYQYHPDTDSLYFSEGHAEPGYRFLSKISLAELWGRFPTIAREVELLKNAKSLSSFSIEIPAVAKAHDTK